jgi:hypothetical protein
MTQDIRHASDVRLRWLDEVCGRGAGLRDEKTEIEYGRNNRRIRQRSGGCQVNIDGQGLTGRGRSGSSPKRTVSLHPGLVVVPGSLGGVVTLVMMMARAVKQEGREPLRANLQRKLAIPAGHEPDGDERAKRQRHHQEAGEPPVLTQICESNGH